MSTNLKYYSTRFLLISFFAFSLLFAGVVSTGICLPYEPGCNAQAQTPGSNTQGNPSSVDTQQNPSMPDTQGNPGSSAGLQNPLAGGGINSIEGLMVALIQIMLVFAVPIVILFIMYSGFLLVTARGNDEQLTKGKRALAYGLVGALLIFGAFEILDIVKHTIEKLQ